MEAYIHCAAPVMWGNVRPWATMLGSNVLLWFEAWNPVTIFLVPWYFFGTLGLYSSEGEITPKKVGTIVYYILWMLNISFTDHIGCISWSFPEASKCLATSGKMVINSWTRWRFSSDISAKESHRRSVCSSCSYPIVWFNCSGTSNDTCCAVVHLTGVSDSFGCLCCGVGPMPDGNGGVIVQLISSTCSVEASGIVSGVTL